MWKVPHCRDGRMILAGRWGSVPLEATMAPPAKRGHHLTLPAAKQEGLNPPATPIAAQ